MLVADPALFVNHQQGRHAPELEKVPLLAIQIGYFVDWIWQSDKGQSFTGPVTAEGLGPIRTDANNDRVTRGEGRQIVAQAREMSAAVGSHEPAQKNQQDIFLTQKIRQAHALALHIR